MCSTVLWHQHLIQLLQGVSPGLENAVVAHTGKEGVLLHEVVSPTLVFTGLWLDVSVCGPAGCSLSALEK